MRRVTQPRVIEEFREPNGNIPFRIWLEGLRDSDSMAAQRIDARLARVITGNLGEQRSVGEGVREMVLDFGPGYRLYFAEDGNTLVILLLGGTKRGQSADIERAKTYWKNYKEEKDESKKNKFKKK